MVYLSHVNLNSNKAGIVNFITKKYNKTSPQVILRWVLEQKTIVFPKSKNPSRIKQDINVFDFKLDDQDLLKLKNIKDESKIQSMDRCANGEHVEKFNINHPLFYKEHFTTNNAEDFIEDNDKNKYL